MEKTFCVYEHLFPNGKRYIGITSKKPTDRWENGSGYEKTHQSAMYYAIQKYGWDNIQHNILFEGLSFEKACAKEKELIAYYKTNIRRYGDAYGYNLTDGGEGTLGHQCSEETKQKISQAIKGKYKGKNCYKSKSVICDGIEYESITDFISTMGLNRTVETWLNGEKAMPVEWFNRGLRYKNQTAKIKVQSVPHSYSLCYDNKIYNSQAELAKELGVSAAIVCCWLSGKKKMPDKIKEKGLYRIK